MTSTANETNHGEETSLLFMIEKFFLNYAQLRHGLKKQAETYNVCEENSD
jgi:hypothetical protein